jgi:predicted methyltransferase
VAQIKTFAAASITALTLAFAAQAQAPNVHDPKPSAAVTAAVADAGRPAEDMARDAGRKPAETVAVSGVKPGDTVVEIAPGAGYFTRILAKAVGPKGKVITVVGTRPGADASIKALQASYPNVSVQAVGFDKLGDLPEKADLVWTTENYHDIHNALDIAAVNKGAFDVLKPGGTYLVEDHASAAGAGLTQTRTLHRIDPKTVSDEVAAAGFKLARTSDVLAVAADDHTGKSGDPALHDKTDRFLLVFRKP